MSWNTANDAVLAEGQRVLINDPTRFDGVSVVGVDEHVWRHTRKGDKYVTVIIDLTPVRDDTGPARLLDMVEGRSKQAFKTWLASRPQTWRDGIEVVAMDGFSGFKTATTEELPDATPGWIRSMSSAWPVMPSTSAGAASNRHCTATAVALPIRSTAPVGPCTPVWTFSLRARRLAWKPCSPAMSTSRSKPPGPSTRR